MRYFAPFVRAGCGGGVNGIADIENTLQKIDEIASYHEGVAAEEALILRG